MRVSHSNRIGLTSVYLLECVSGDDSVGGVYGVWGIAFCSDPTAWPVVSGVSGPRMVSV